MPGIWHRGPDNLHIENADLSTTPDQPTDQPEPDTTTDKPTGNGANNGVINTGRGRVTVIGSVMGVGNTKNS